MIESKVGIVASGARSGDDLIAKAAQNITLHRSRDIPFNNLVLSQSNVRRIKADVSVKITAEDNSLTENMQRVALHPLDQFRAFLALHENS